MFDDDMTYLTDLDKQEQQKQDDKLRDIERSDFTTVMSTRSGRNVMYRQLMKTGVFNDTYHHDSHHHAMLAGRRSIGIMMIKDLEQYCPGEYFTMIKENSDAT